MDELGATRTAPAQPPAGFWIGHPRYRSYVLFAATGVMLWVGGLIVLGGVAALGTGAAAWDDYLANLGSALGVVMMTLILIPTLFFALRWLRVGVKVQTVEIGPLPRLPAPVWLVLYYAAFGALTALLLLLLGGVIL